MHGQRMLPLACQSAEGTCHNVPPQGLHPVFQADAQSLHRVMLSWECWSHAVQIICDHPDGHSEAA